MFSLWGFYNINRGFLFAQSEIPKQQSKVLTFFRKSDIIITNIKGVFYEIKSLF